VEKKLSKCGRLDIQCNGINIINKVSVNYLGCELDQDMSGEAMANKVIEKVNSKTKFMARLSHILDKDTLKVLANSIVLCNFDYDCSAWYTGLSKTNKHRLQIAQNKLIRVVLGLPYRTHLSYAHFKKLNWLPVEKRVIHLQLGHVYNALYNSRPSYFSDYLVTIIIIM
jgi:hypothetical protein